MGGFLTATLVKGTILGGLVLFLWGALSWMALPWHQATLLPFSNEDAVTQWSFSGPYTLLAFADLIIGWFLAGLVIAGITGQKSKKELPA